MAYENDHGEHYKTYVEGNKKTTLGYSVDTSGFGYTTFDDESGIRDLFNFLIVDMPNKLDEVVSYLESAGSISDAFAFNDVHDIANACESIEKDINVLKNTLAELHSAFMMDMDNVNAELAVNFGWVRIGKVKHLLTKVEDVETADSK